MNCVYCLKPLGFYDWGYMIMEDESLVYAHLDCIAWEEAMERAETLSYLEAALTF